MSSNMLAIIPARGGSKGLPGKNIRPLAGMPLIVHAIELAKRSPEIAHTIVSTDSEAIAATARNAGGDAPFLRPPELARDDTPTLPVLQHAVSFHEKRSGQRVETVLLLQPTGPLRLPDDVAAAAALLAEDREAVGVMSVSAMEHNPLYVCVQEDGRGHLHRAFNDAAHAVRRQDLPALYRINGMIYLWRRDYVMGVSAVDLDGTPHRMLVLPRERAIDIDDEYDLQLAEWTLRSGLVKLPWLAGRAGGGA